MKNNHIHLKRLAAISLVVVMCLSALPMLAPPAAAEPIVVSNDRTEDRVVFEQDYSELYHVPTNLVMLNNVAPYRINNVTLRYNYTANAVNLFALGTSATGALHVAGLYPAVETNITMDLEFSRINSNTGFEVKAGNAYIQVILWDGISGEQEIDYLRIKSMYYDAAGTLQISDLPLTNPVYPRYQNIARFNLSIHSSNVEQVNEIYVDGRLILTTPYYPTNPPSAFSPFSNPFVQIKMTGQNDVRWGDLNIYSITQTVPGYRYVTPISNPNVTAFGIDGPHAVGLVDDGISLMASYGARGTIWAGESMATYTPAEVDELRAIVAGGWELGVHYSARLTDLSMEDAIALMNAEYLMYSDIFGQSPTSWCSLQNADNVSHANYAYANLGMAWRNGYNGVRSFSNVGNLADTYMEWWGAASAAGLVFPTFTHRLDEEPAIPYSVSPSNLTIWLDNYAAAGVSIVGYYEYWTLAQNTYHTQVTDLSIENGKALSFTIDNIGGRSRLFVAAPFAEIVVDGDGNEIAWESVDGGIIIEVEAGEYQIMTMSAYRQAQIDTAISPLYAIIPVVLVFGVIGGLFTMLGRLKF